MPFHKTALMTGHNPFESKLPLTLQQRKKHPDDRIYTQYQALK